jgi:hypothetical protein
MNGAPMDCEWLRVAAIGDIDGALWRIGFSRGTNYLLLFISMQYLLVYLNPRQIMQKSYEANEFGAGSEFRWRAPTQC